MPQRKLLVIVKAIEIKQRKNSRIRGRDVEMPSVRLLQKHLSLAATLDRGSAVEIPGHYPMTAALFTVQHFLA
jgi:hypothetical protein